MPTCLKRSVSEALLNTVTLLTQAACSSSLIIITVSDTHRTDKGKQQQNTKGKHLRTTQTLKNKNNILKRETERNQMQNSWTVSNNRNTAELIGTNQTLNPLKIPNRIVLASHTQLKDRWGCVHPPSLMLGYRYNLGYSKMESPGQVLLKRSLLKQ